MRSFRNFYIEGYATDSSFPHICMDSCHFREGSSDKFEHEHEHKLKQNKQGN